MAIPETIKQLANKVRTAVYGKDVRESLAKSMEETGNIADETKTRQGSLETQFQSVLNETTGKDVISAPEIIAAKVGSDGVNHPNLKDRLDKEYNKVTSELAQKADQEDVTDLQLITDMLSPYYARKNQEFLGMVSRKLRYKENVTITFYGDSNSMRSTSLYQTTMLTALNGAYNNKISRIDRAYPGDSAEMGYERWTTAHTGDISVICFGTNDSTFESLYGYPEATKVKDYLYWMEKLITRELNWGKAVILVSPIPTRNDKRWETKTQYFPTDPWPDHFRADAYVFGNVCEWLAEKYSAPFVDSREILANFEDEIFANSNGNSLGTATTDFGDPVHLVDDGLKAWGGRVASIFYGDSLLRKQKAVDGTAFATRKGEDPFTTNADVFNTATRKVKYYSPYAWAVGDNVAGNRALELQNGEEITYSFYCDSEDLIVYPNLYVFSNSLIEVKLDYGYRQPLSTLDEKLKAGSNYGYNGTSKITFDTRTDTNATFNITKAEHPDTKEVNRTYLDRGIKIASKGWHTINIRAVEGFVAVSGIRFRSAQNDKIDSIDTRVKTLETTPNTANNITDLNGTDLNTLTASGVYYAFSATNRPVTVNGVVKHSEKVSDNSIAIQEYFPNGDASKMWMRLKVSGTWQAWTQIK